MKELDLLRLCIKGDLKAQKELFMMHSSDLFTVAVRYTRTREDAEDVLQEAWVKIFHNLSSYQDFGKLFFWMKKIVINQALRNRNNKWFKTELVEEMPIVESITPKVLEQLNGEEILKLIDQLPEGYSEVFKLHVIEGYKHQEIGELMNIGESTSRSKLTIARKKMRQLVQQSKIVQI